MKHITSLIIVLLLTGSVACKKENSPGGNTGGGSNNGGTDTGTVVTPTDPPVENTVGFFLDNWTPKTFSATAYTEAAVPGGNPAALVTVDASKIIAKVPSSVFGQNANSWMSQFVTEPVLTNHIKNLQPNIIRFPGGSISDTYFWNASNNQPPADAPPSLLDANGTSHSSSYWYGKNPDSWTCSVDNYYNMLQQTGNQGLITVNYGYARYGTGSDPVAQAAHLAADWVRYDNGRTKYWEVGNECNGVWETGYRINTTENKDGQPEIVTGALYAQHAKVFIDSMRKAAQEIGKTIYIGAYILEKQPESWQTQTDQTWNSGVFANIADKPDYYVIHSYYTPYMTNASADEILATASNNTAAMMTYVKTNMTANGAAVKPIALDEWNITSSGSMQQVSHINGMHAAILLGEAIKNKYGMTSRWDLANSWFDPTTKAPGNDHGLFNIGDEPGVSKWNPRPAFYYMYYFQKMIGDRMLPASFSYGNNVLAYASSFTSGQKGIILVNKATASQVAQVALNGAKTGNRFYWYTLTGGNDNGEFSRKIFVNGQGPTEVSGGPATTYTTIKPYSAFTSGGIKVDMPARSVVCLVID